MGGVSARKQNQRDRARKAREKKRKKDQADNISDSDDDNVKFCDEPCDAVRPKCRRPTGTVTWIGCDTCQGWFHYVCVGMTKARVPEKNYECRVCREARETRETQDEQRSLHMFNVRSPRASPRYPQVYLSV